MIHLLGIWVLYFQYGKIMDGFKFYPAWYFLSFSSGERATPIFMKRRNYNGSILFQVVSAFRSYFTAVISVQSLLVAFDVLIHFSWKLKRLNSDPRFSE